MASKPKTNDILHRERFNHSDRNFRSKECTDRSFPACVKRLEPFVYAICFAANIVVGLAGA